MGRKPPSRPGSPGNSKKPRPIDAPVPGMLPRAHLAPAGRLLILAAGLVWLSCGCWPAHGPSAYGKIHQCAISGDVDCVAGELQADPKAVNLPEDYGLTPLHLAAQYCHSNVAALLLQHGATVDSRASDQATPLHLAAQEGCTEVVTLLLEHHAAIEAKDDQGRTPLMRAEQWHQTNVVELLKNWNH